MTDTLFADVSEFQVPVNDLYPHKFLSFRSNDGTYYDQKFDHNYAWAKTAANSGKLTGFIVYFVWEPNWQQTVQILKSRIGTPHAKMAVMIDIESWGGRISGNQSAGLNGARESIIAWLGGNRKRVIGYGNAGDLNSLWPQRGDTKVIYANYGGNPGFPGAIAHQFADNYVSAPFGACDINSADGYTPAAFAAALGLSAAPAPKPPTPKPPVPVKGGDRWTSPIAVTGGHSIRSSNGYTCTFQTDGNLVARNPRNAVLWATYTNNQSALKLQVQSDGNVVIYNNRLQPIWNTGTSGRGNVTLIMQTDGNLVLRTTSTGLPVWNSGTVQ